MYSVIDSYIPFIGVFVLPYLLVCLYGNRFPILGLVSERIILDSVGLYLVGCVYVMSCICYFLMPRT